MPLVVRMVQFLLAQHLFAQEHLQPSGELNQFEFIETSKGRIRQTGSISIADGEHQEVKAGPYLLMSDSSRVNDHVKIEVKLKELTTGEIISAPNILTSPNQPVKIEVKPTDDSDELKLFSLSLYSAPAS